MPKVLCSAGAPTAHYGSAPLCREPHLQKWTAHVVRISPLVMQPEIQPGICILKNFTLSFKVSIWICHTRLFFF